VTPKEIDQRVELFRGLLRDRAGTSVVARKREVLRAHAQALLEQRFEFAGPAAALGGKLEALGGERVRVSYAFDDPRELQDFSVDLYPLVAARTLQGKNTESEPFHVERGALRALGRCTLRSLYDLEAPLVVRYDLEFEDVKLEQPAFYLALGICDDGREHFVWAVNLSSLQVLDAGGTRGTPEASSSFFLDKSYALELRHDGERARLLCDGKDQGSLDAGTRRSGAVFLDATTDLPLSIQKLSIEGRLRADSFERLKRTWAARQLAGL
jgi:hypothetical protein